MESFRTFSSLELVRAKACNRYVNILHSIGMRQHQLHFDGVIASRWDAYLFCYLCRHFASVMLRLASLISHNLRCIPAYTHQIPMGFFFNHYQIITGTTCISPPKLFDVGGQNLMWEGQSLAIRSIALVRSVFSFPFRPCDELPSRSCEASLFRFYGMPLPTG